MAETGRLAPLADSSTPPWSSIWNISLGRYGANQTPSLEFDRRIAAASRAEQVVAGLADGSSGVGSP